MNKIRLLTLLFCGFMLSIIGSVQAQTIKMSPKTPSVALGKTVQFSAIVTGLSNTDVTWYSGGVAGGNSTAGTIDSSGLYTAPTTMPAQNPVLIRVRSKALTSLSTSTYLNLLDIGPTITSVSPNPLSPGTVAVTIKGGVFKQYAVMFISYGANQLIQMSTDTVASDTITATGYLGAASTATFCVKNPGSDYSNSITVPVTGSSSEKRTLTVVNGSGGGSYAPGAVVNITANAAPIGQQFVNWTGAAVANSNTSTTTITMPASNTTVTANYTGGAAGQYTLTVVNGSGGGSYVPGAVVNITANAAPIGQQFVNWTGGAVANANAASTTITMPSVNTTLTANYAGVAVSIPFPVTTHPRLWVTPADLPRLQGWATASNPVYQNGLLPLLNQAINIYNTQFFPGGSANANWPDPGDTQGYQGYLTEQYAFVLAFHSLINPNATNRATYAKMARNILMVAMNQAALGHLSGAPFRDPLFAVYNRANADGEKWGLIVDWIYNAVDAQNSLILTAADKLTIRNVFLIWANDCINAYTTGGDHPAPIGVMNSPQLLPVGKPYRMAANNYYLGHARLLTMMALSMDPADDPLVNAALPASQLGNTLRSYILNANGAWLYQEYAMMGEPSDVAAAYGLQNSAGLGLASGGLPPEGMLYGHSFGFVLGQLLALQTAGFNNPAYSGPQIALIGSPVWDKHINGMLAEIEPKPYIDPNQSYLGPVYRFAGWGDMLRLWITPDSVQPFALKVLLDQQNGKTGSENAARWWATNALEGGVNAFYSRITQPWSWGVANSIFYYLLFDPAAPVATDPRPSLPNVFTDQTQGRVIAHTDWTTNATVFGYRGSWLGINHMTADCGQFSLYRKGEYLTKQMSNYDNNALGMTSRYQNTLGLQNTCPNGTPTNLQWYEAGEWANGSQWMLGFAQGDPVTSSSSGANYVYANTDMTKLYNRPNQWTPGDSAVNITQATRSILWLNNDYVVIYDRATSLNTGLFKRFNLNLVNSPNIQGNVMTETMASGQRLFMQTLLPANPTITSVFTAGGLNPVANMEPTRFTMAVEDITKPTDTRFLHVLQGADAGVQMVPAMYLTSIQGTQFDGAAFGNSAVFFPTSATSVFASTTFSVPMSVHNLIVTGLAANASFTVSVAPGINGSLITVTPNGAGATTDSAGVLTFNF